jgi:hypothetical protein
MPHRQSLAIPMLALVTTNIPMMNAGRHPLASIIDFS